jgi:hypothetical protein
MDELPQRRQVENGTRLYISNILKKIATKEFHNAYIIPAVFLHTYWPVFS